MAVKILFDGMCGIVNRGMRFEAFLMPGDDHQAGEPRHEASLVAPIRGISTTIQNLWEPDLVGIDSSGEQIGIWRIPFGTEIEIGGAAATDWRDRADGLDMQVFHPGKTTKARAVILREHPDASVISLGGGSMRGPKTRKLKKIQDGSTVEKDFVSQWEWASNDNVLNNRTTGLRIEFRNNPIAGITNVARIPEGQGLGHYFHYYLLVEQPVSEDKQVKIASPTGDEDVYDCIPPAPLP